MAEDCMALWHAKHFQVKSQKTDGLGAFLDVQIRQYGRRGELLMHLQNYQNERVWYQSNYNHHLPTLHSTPLHYITYYTYNYNYNSLRYT